MSCESCAEVPHSSHWVLVVPEVSTEKSGSIFRLSSPAGSYECSESGLCWTCAGPVTLQYHFIDWHLLADDLPHLQYRPAGPSMDIKFISGELEEIHLSHFLCLGGSQSSLKDAVEILHKQDSGVSIEKCELSRFHARLVNPSFSLLGVFYSLKSVIFPGQEEEREKQIKIHADVLVYQSSRVPLIFRTYILPMDTNSRRLVEDQEKLEGFRGRRQPKHRPVRPMQMDGFYVLQTDCFKTDCSKPDCNSRIYPVQTDLTDRYFVPNFYDVHLKEVVNFKLELLSSEDKQKVWQAEILRVQCSNNPQQDIVNTSTEVPASAPPHTANVQTPVEVSTTSTVEVSSGSSSPVQPASVSSSITAHDSGTAVAPTFHSNSRISKSCESCAEVPDSCHWFLMKPEVSREKSVSTYSLTSPAGSYECSESGLRWTCAGSVTLQYRFTDWYVFSQELPTMQSSPAGPLMNISVMSGELEEIHLPHFLCLGGSEASVRDAVRVLHERESGVGMEVCELTRHHARILHPSFSLLGLVYNLRNLLSPKIHCVLLLFCTRTAPLVLHTYLVPNDPAHIRAIHQKEENRGVWIDKPSAVGPLLLNDSVCVRTLCPSEIQPKKMNLWPLSTGNYSEVYINQPEAEFDMEVISSQHTEPIWTVKIYRDDYCQPSRSPGQGSSQGANTAHTM
ncbi:hypothetical protein AALO_G00118250 [Alosa alosa]|uniref:FIIND domain-containing protein n=1 Tax=Alosa alosa TaxID=278164 RepID=A0AAV6GV88_9TELE|nr:uncharacterized protein LOC125298795 [Alosa alosa]KAG5277491.1 hypothetical protein AALO_G00118250 [Alosa alosa]